MQPKQPSGDTAGSGAGHTHGWQGAGHTHDWQTTAAPTSPSNPFDLPSGEKKAWLAWKGRFGNRVTGVKKAGVFFVDFVPQTNYQNRHVTL